MIDFIKEFFEFLLERKKYWLFPIIIVLALFGILIVLSQGTAIAPFIYTIFYLMGKLKFVLILLLVNFLLLEPPHLFIFNIFQMISLI